MSSPRQFLGPALLGAAILSALVFTGAMPLSASLAPTAAYDQDSIQGKITAKTEISVTVDARMIMTSPATAVSKNGKPGTMADVNVGDKVKVMTKKNEDGGLQAVMIEVSARPGEPAAQ